MAKEIKWGKIDKTTGMEMGFNPSPVPFVDDCNCTYTTSGDKDIKMSIPALLELMNSIPAKPKILTVGIKVKLHTWLPDNTIFISKDIADALEQALKGGEK